MNKYSVIEISILKYSGKYLKIQEIEYEEIEYKERQI